MRDSTVSSFGSSKGTVEMPAGFSTTKTCASAKTTSIGARSARLSARGAFGVMTTVAFEGTFFVPSVHTTPFTETLPRSTSLRASPQLMASWLFTCPSSGAGFSAAENVVSMGPLQHGEGTDVEGHDTAKKLIRSAQPTLSRPP